MGSEDLHRGHQVSLSPQLYPWPRLIGLDPSRSRKNHLMTTTSGRKNISSAPLGPATVGAGTRTARRLAKLLETTQEQPANSRRLWRLLEASTLTSSLALLIASAILGMDSWRRRRTGRVIWRRTLLRACGKLQAMQGRFEVPKPHVNPHRCKAWVLSQVQLECIYWHWL